MLVALGKRVIIKKKIRQKKSVILTIEDDKYDHEVTHIGDCVTKVNVSDIVFPNPYSIVTFEHDGVDYLAVEEDHIFAKISP